MPSPLNAPKTPGVAGPPVRNAPRHTPPETVRPNPPTTSDLVARRVLYPIREAAWELGVHRTTLYQRYKEGRLQLLRDGGRTFVHKDELDRYVREEVHPVGLISRQNA